MKQLSVKVNFLKKLKTNVYLLGFYSPYLAKTAGPGQFLHIKVDEKVTVLRRPLSIHKVIGDMIYLLFRVRGRGTKLLVQYRAGDTLDIIGPLGKGFTVRPQRAERSEASPKGTANHRPQTGKEAVRILVAGGMGVAPLVFLAQKLKTHSAKCIAQSVALLGAKSKKDILGEKEFKKLGFKVQVATDDGSGGFKGTVTELLKKELRAKSYEPCLAGRQVRTALYACGPVEMFYEIARAMKKYPQIDCQVSFEQFMGCGLGICCGCSIETKNGFKKVCTDGPVFNLSQI